MTALTVRHITAPTTEQVRHQRFSPVRLREGYDMGEVDQFLDAIVQTLEMGATTPPAPAPRTVGALVTAACGICYAQVTIADEDAHRVWHVSLLAGRVS